MAEKSEPEDPRAMDLVELTRVWGPAEAEIVKSLLRSEGIPAILRGQAAQGLYPFMTDGMGEIKILIPAKDLEIARKLLSEKGEPSDETA